MYFPQVLRSLECSRPWKASERCKPVPRHKIGEEPTVFTGDVFHSAERQVCNEMWLQNTYLCRWQVLSHSRLGSSKGGDRLAPNMTPRDPKYLLWNGFNGKCLSMIFSCRTWWGGLDLDQGVYWSMKSSISQRPLVWGMLETVPPWGRIWYDAICWGFRCVVFDCKGYYWR